jgi:PBP1b-binding outer membrane lipoprotein LpoB
MKKISLLISGFLLSVFLTSCHEGPAESKGKKIDSTVEKIQDKLQNKGPAQKAGEKVDKLTGNS